MSLWMTGLVWFLQRAEPVPLSGASSILESSPISPRRGGVFDKGSLESVRYVCEQAGQQTQTGVGAGSCPPRPPGPGSCIRRCVLHGSLFAHSKCSWPDKLPTVRRRVEQSCRCSTAQYRKYCCVRVYGRAVDSYVGACVVASHSRSLARIDPQHRRAFGGNQLFLDPYADPSTAAPSASSQRQREEQSVR